MRHDVTPIFILSLPRAGSTLLQRLLASNPEVSTVSEPWVCLPLVFSLKSEVFSVYGHRAAQHGVNSFLDKLPEGRSTYLQRLGGMIQGLYSLASPGNATFFVDKTPRYHMIISELFEMFPEGKFIFLWRNPLSVLASFIGYFSNDRWMPELYSDDLRGGMRSLVDGYLQNKDRAIAVSYERLVAEPELVMQELYGYLGLSTPGSADLGWVDESGWGDERAKSSDKVDKSSVEKWKKILRNKFRSSWADQYLDWIGAKRLGVMGYDLPSLKSELAQISSNYHQSPLDMFFYWLGVLKHKVRTKVLKHG